MLILTSIIVGGLLTGCNPYEDEFAYSSSEEWSEEAIQNIVDDEKTSKEILEEVKKYEDKLEKEDVSTVFETILYGLEYDAQRYNEILSNAFPEMTRFLGNYPNVSFTSDEGWDDVEDGLIKGLKNQTENQPLKWVESTDSIYVEVDYDEIVDKYSHLLSSVVKNKITLAKHISNHPDHKSDTNTLDFETIWERLEMIDSFKTSGDFDEQLESQEYYYTMVIYGFGESTMNETEDKISQTALNDMRAVAHENKGHKTADNMIKIINKIEEDGYYSDEVLDLANDILNEQFAELIGKVEDQMEEDIEDGLNPEEVEETVEEVIEGDE